MLVAAAGKGSDFAADTVLRCTTHEHWTVHLKACRHKHTTCLLLLAAAPDSDAAKHAFLCPAAMD
jgi:hypothetical protein